MYILENGKKKKIQVDTSTRIGRGAAATVYPLQGKYAGKVAKMYHDPAALDREKIEAMIANPPAQGGQTLSQYAWPEALIFEKSQPVGYMMPEIHLSDTVDLETAINPMLRERFGLKNLDAMPLRVTLARNLAAALANLHANGHFFIDLKPQNVRLYKEGKHALVTVLLDCDGFRIQGDNGRIYPGTVFSSEYIAPEALVAGKMPGELGEEQDRFALAVLIFQVLNNGIHPFQGIVGKKDHKHHTTIDAKIKGKFYPHGLHASAKIRPLDTSLHHCFPDATRKLFDRAFVGGISQRPSARAWYRHLSELLDPDKGYFQKCPSKPSDPGHIHFSGKPCVKGCHGGQRQSSTPKGSTSSSVRPVSHSSSAVACPHCGSLSTAELDWRKYGILTLWKLDFMECGNCGKPYGKNGEKLSRFKMFLWKYCSHAVTLLAAFLLLQVAGAIFL